MFHSESRHQKSEQDFDQKNKEVIEPKERSVVQRPHLSGANKRMFNLLRKAKVQLIKIDQQKQLKSSGVGMNLLLFILNVGVGGHGGLNFFSLNPHYLSPQLNILEQKSTIGQNQSNLRLLCSV